MVEVCVIFMGGGCELVGGVRLTGSCREEVGSELTKLGNTSLKVGIGSTGGGRVEAEGVSDEVISQST